MISKQDVEKLANLSRLSLTEIEKDSFLKEIDAILGYVGGINSIASSVSPIDHKQYNVLRDDIVANEKSEYSEALLSNAPEREDNYVKVKKILGND